jgi:hypothetical protein
MFLFQIHLKLSSIVSTSYDQIRDKSTHGTKQSIFKKENVWKIETQNENYISDKLILQRVAILKFGKC